MREISRFILLILLIVLPVGYSSTRGSEPVAPSGEDTCQALFETFQLAGQVEYAAFRQAMEGLSRVDAPRKEILTLIDFSQPSTRQRLFVLDLKQKKVLFQSLVAHGQGSGENYATKFSNRNGSHMSSLGFYLTGHTYQGGKGYSLILEGLEAGINDRARERSIVIHAAAYANPSVVASGGRLGRSHGCPALPEKINRAVIDVIKDGTLLYIYAKDPDYLAHSPILSSVPDIL